MGATIKVNESTDGQGVVVTLRFDDGTKQCRYLAYGGGEWLLASDGTLGMQMAGTSDVRVPRDLPRAQRWAEQQYADLVA